MAVGLEGGGELGLESVGLRQAVAGGEAVAEDEQAQRRSPDGRGTERGGDEKNATPRQRGVTDPHAQAISRGHGRHHTAPDPCPRHRVAAARTGEGTSL